MMEGDSKPPPPFLQRTYEMVDDPLTDAIVSWSPSGLSFVVWNPLEFATDLLPKHFKHNNFSSFIRQLNTYGFRKVDPEQWEFSNEEFVRGRKHLLRNIHRRKPVYRHNKAQSDPERDEFLRTIKSLEQENRSLHSDLEKYRLHNREYETNLRFLWQVLNDIDQRQRKLMAGLSQLPESPSKRRRLTHLRDEYRELSMGLPEDKDVVESHDLNGCLYDDNSGNNCSSDDSYLSNSMEPAPESPLLPPIPSICMDLEMVDKLVENETVDSRLVDLDSARPAGGADVGANDVFWQQFLNEGPDSWVMQAVQ